MKKLKQMTKNQARNFILENARFMPDAPKTPYYVRFPSPFSGKIFFSADTAELLDQLFNFGRTKEGKELWAKIPAGRYDEAPEEIEFEDEEDVE